MARAAARAGAWLGGAAGRWLVTRAGVPLAGARLRRAVRPRVLLAATTSQRGLGGSRLRSHPWWLYGPLPAALPAAVEPAPAASPGRARWRDDRLARLGLAWLRRRRRACCRAARFKRADYLLPAYPARPLFLGCCAGSAARPALASDRPWPASVGGRRGHARRLGRCASAWACRRRKRIATIARSPPPSAGHAPAPPRSRSSAPRRTRWRSAWAGRCRPS